MDKSEAYKIVFDDLIQCNLFRGIYDAKHGNNNFMYGIGTVMEYIAHSVSEECLEKFNKEFTQNMITSKEKAKIEPIEKKVTKEEFDEFIKNYPRSLKMDMSGISDPPCITYNDFELASWPYSVVARTWAYSNEPGDYFYEPEDKRSYIIMVNYKEVFDSRIEIAKQ